MVSGTLVLTLTLFVHYLLSEVGRFLSAFAFGLCLCIALAVKHGIPLYQVISSIKRIHASGDAQTQNVVKVDFKGLKLLTPQNVRELTENSLEEQHKACLEQLSQWKSKLTEVNAAELQGNSRVGSLWNRKRTSNKYAGKA